MNQTLGSTVALRTFAGIGGGIFGTLVLLGVYFFTSALLPQTQSGISTFAVISMIFLGTLSTNIVTGILLGYADSTKYRDQAGMLTQIFGLNMTLFLLTLPLYLFAGGNAIQEIASFHLLLSAIGSALLSEMIAGIEYRVTAVYGIVFGGFFSISIVGLLLKNGFTPTTLIFFAMPLVWATITFATGISEIVAPKVGKILGE